MAEIDNWIKEQLKKGYKKEQIKEGLRKAGYPQDVIDSVDLFSKKQKNKNIIFFLGLIAVLIIIFIVGNYAWNHRSTVPEMYKFSDFPSNIEELNRFVDFCNKPILYEGEINEMSALCILEFNKDLNVYEPSYKNVDEIEMLKQGQYISFNVDLTKIIKDSLQKKVLSLSNNETFNLCIVSTPLLDDNVHPVMLEEGVVICLPNLTLDEPRIGSITSKIRFIGFIPESEFFSIKVYSVPYEKIPEILSKKDFNEKKNSC